MNLAQVKYAVEHYLFSERPHNSSEIGSLCLMKRSIKKLEIFAQIMPLVLSEKYLVA